MHRLTILRYLCALFWLTTRVGFVSAQAASPSNPRNTLSLGSGAPLVLTADVDEAGARLHASGLSVRLPMRAVDHLETEVVHLRGGASVGIVRLSAAAQKAAVLLVKRGEKPPEVLWTGRLDWSGDPGERHADALEVSDRDGDGHADIVVGTYAEQVSVCGEARTLIAPRAVDPKTLALRPVLLNRAAQRPVSSQLLASPAAPTLHVPPTLRALRGARAASAHDALHEAPALIDGDLHTGWVEGRGLGGRFEFVTVNWSAPSRPIVALALSPLGAAPDAGVSLAKVRALSLLGPKGERLAIKLPEDAKPGERYWVVPPSPLAWSCLTLMIDEVAAPDLRPQTHSGLAELEAYTELDRSDGLVELVAALGQPGASGDDAASLLGQVQGDVIAAVDTAWSTLPSTGKRRALRLLLQPQLLADARTPELLRRALRDPDTEVKEAAFKLATERTQVGYAPLEELAHSATTLGDRAAKVIAHADAQRAFESLLGVLGEPGASERAALRDALTAAYQAAPTGHDQALAPWLESGTEAAAKPLSARVALALALSRAPAAHPLAAQLLRQLAGQTREFSDQWRLVQVAQLLPSEAPVDAWLRELAEQSDAWMLRAAALDALQRRTPALAEPAAERALGDPYPRVRATAVGILASARDPFARLQKSLREDSWFLVRQAGLDKLPDSPAARAWFVEALRDSSPVVRASAIRALGRVGAAPAWDAIRPVVENAQEYPEVTAEGIAFARALCLRAAVPSLRQIATRGLAPDADSADQELALSALETLSSFGGDDAVWARDHSVSPAIPKAVQLTAAAAATQPSACKPKSVP